MHDFRNRVRRLKTGWAAGIALLLVLAAGAASAQERIPGITASATGQWFPGKLVWADLLTDDLDLATRFYSTVFGWEIERNFDDYATVRLNGQPFASITTYADDQQHAGEALWLMSISVEDVDASTRAARQAGGTVLDKAESLPGRGRASVVQDPTGAVVMLLRSEGGDPVDDTPIENAWLWAELWTSDPATAADFYADVAGYDDAQTVQTRNLAQGGTRDYHMLVNDGVARAGLINTPLEGVGSNWLPYLLVADLRATARAVKRHGGRVLIPPMDDGEDGALAIVADPTGGVFALQQMGDDD